MHKMDLAQKIPARTAEICVIGLGYVGLPLAVALAEVGFPVMGLDVDADRVVAIGRGESYIRDVSDDTLSTQVRAGRLRAELTAATAPPRRVP